MCIPHTHTHTRTHVHTVIWTHGVLHNRRFRERHLLKAKNEEMREETRVQKVRIADLEFRVENFKLLLTAVKDKCKEVALQNHVIATHVSRFIHIRTATYSIVQQPVLRALNVSPGRTMLILLITKCRCIVVFCLCTSVLRDRMGRRVGVNFFVLCCVNAEQDTTRPGAAVCSRSRHTSLGGHRRGPVERRQA